MRLLSAPGVLVLRFASVPFLLPSLTRLGARRLTLPSRLFPDRQGADEYLPLLIYAILQAAPPNLHSNVQYIMRCGRHASAAAAIVVPSPRPHSPHACRFCPDFVHP